MKLWLGLLAATLAGACAVHGARVATPVSTPFGPTEDSPSLNHRPLRPDPTPHAYTYFVAGHLYGAPRNKHSIFPSASILGNIDRINAAEPEFFVGLGDIVRESSPLHLEKLRSGLLDRLETPVLNSVGNHDTSNRDNYLQAFPGPTTYQFTHGRVLHIVLDTELDVGRVSGTQLEWLLELLRAAETDEAVATIAIYSHKLLSIVGRAEYEIVARHVNNPFGYQADSKFSENLLPALRRLAEAKPVVWFAGDIGCSHTLPLWYAKESGVDLVWIATGIGDTEQDAMLEVEVEEDGHLSIRVARLDGLPSPPLETYDVEFWKQHFEQR